GDIARAARREVQRIGMGHVYRSRGVNAQIEEVSRSFGVFVWSSRFEAWSGSALGAFLDQGPTVTRDAGGVPDTRTGARGWPAPGGDAQAIADACEEILTHPELAQEKVQTAHRWVRQEHGVEQMLDRYEQFYTQHVS